MTSQLTGAAERFGVGASSPVHEIAVVQTNFGVQRWDEDQTSWTLRKLGFGDTRAPLPEDQGLTPRHFAAVNVEPYSETLDENCNLIVQSGWVAILGSIAGTSIATKFSASAGRIGVGTVATTATYSDTHLGGDGSSSTAWYKLVSGAPVISTGSTPPTLVFTASFGTGVANFAWAEFGTDNGASDSNTVSGVFLNHGISNQGTKVAGQTWTATETIQLGYPSGSGAVS